MKRSSDYVRFAVIWTAVLFLFQPACAENSSEVFSDPVPDVDPLLSEGQGSADPEESN